jgi:thioredoxin-like negative regulator of GroEL
MAPVLEELASRYTGRVKFAILNVDTNGAVASSYNVTGVPTLFFYNRGKLVDRAVGALPKRDVERYLQTLVQAT